MFTPPKVEKFLMKMIIYQFLLLLNMTYFRLSLLKCPRNKQTEKYKLLLIVGGLGKLKILGRLEHKCIAASSNISWFLWGNTFLSIAFFQPTQQLDI